MSNHGLRNCRTIGFLGVFLSTKNNVRINQESPWTFWKGKQVALETPFFLFQQGFPTETPLQTSTLSRDVKADTTNPLLETLGHLNMSDIHLCLQICCLVALPQNPCYSWQTFIDAREHLTCTYMPSADVVLYSNQKLRTLDSQNFITYYRAMGMK